MLANSIKVGTNKALRNQARNNYAFLQERKKKYCTGRQAGLQNACALPFLQPMDTLSIFSGAREVHRPRLDVKFFWISLL